MKTQENDWGKRQEKNWKELVERVTVNVAYIATRRKPSTDDTSRYARLMAVDGDEMILRAFFNEAVAELARMLSIPYQADCLLQAVIENEALRYTVAYMTGRWLHTVQPDEADYYDLLAARLLDHLSELAYRRRSLRPTRRRLRPF